MASVQSYFMDLFLRFFVNKNKLATAPIRVTRKSLEKLTSMAVKPKGIATEAVICNGVSAEWSTPKNLNNDAVMLYLHGGGYVSGSVKTHRALVANIALAANCKCLSVEYSLAPEKPFPAGLDDAVNVYKWLLEQGINNKNIVIAGDSAGGGLAAATLLKLRDDKLPLPAGGVLMSPWLDLECTGESAERLAKKDAMVPKKALQRFGIMYAKDNLQNPYASPLNADLKGLPPVLIQVSNTEILLDDTLRFEQLAKPARAEIKVQIVSKMPHVWQAYSPMLPEATKSINQIGHFVKQITP